MNICRFGCAVPILLALTLACHGKELSPEELHRVDAARALYSDRKFDQAREILLPLSRENPGSLEIGVLLGRVYFFTRDFQAAEATLREVLKHREHSPYALLWLGKVVASDAKRQAQAAEIFRQVLKEDPENYSAHYFLGRCLEADGKIQQALLEYERASALEYQASKLHLHMGDLFKRLSMEERARHHYRRVEELNLYPMDVQAVRSARAGE